MFERRRWETATRYYETIVMRDLLGDCVLIKRWGGKFNRISGSKTAAVGAANVNRELGRIENERRARGYDEVMMTQTGSGLAY
jgi:hypothetical protein